MDCIIIVIAVYFWHLLVFSYENLWLRDEPSKVLEYLKSLELSLYNTVKMKEVDFSMSGSIEGTGPSLRVVT
jgi:hypothetical protein